MNLKSAQGDGVFQSVNARMKEVVYINTKELQSIWEYIQKNSLLSTSAAGEIWTPAAQVLIEELL